MSALPNKLGFLLVCITGLCACDNAVGLGSSEDAGTASTDAMQNDATVDADSVLDASVDAPVDAPGDMTIDLNVPDMATSESEWDDVELPTLRGLDFDYLIDFADNEHFALADSGDDVLVYASRGADGVLRTTTVTTDVEITEKPSLAVDALARPRIAYIDSSSQRVCYAELGSSGWESFVIDEAGDASGAVFLTLDSLGDPAIGFHDTGSNNGIARRLPGGEWDVVTLNSVSGGNREGPTLAYDSLDRLHILVANEPGRLRYAILNWPETDPPFSSFLSASAGWIQHRMVIDSMDRAHVIAVVDDGGGMVFLFYGVGPESAFLPIEMLDHIAPFSSGFDIDVHPTHGVGLAYGYYPENDLFYRAYLASTWTREELDVSSGGEVYSRELEFDSVGNPHIAYYLHPESLHLITHH